MSTLSVSIKSELHREVALAQREAELERREAALVEREQAIAAAEAGFIERERKLAQGVAAVEAQRQRLVDIRDEYERRRQQLTDRARELDEELRVVRAAQAELALGRDTVSRQRGETGGGTRAKLAAPATRG